MYGLIDDFLEFLGLANIELHTLADFFPWLLRAVITILILSSVFGLIRSIGKGKFFR